MGIGFKIPYFQKWPKVIELLALFVDFLLEICSKNHGGSKNIGDITITAGNSETLAVTVYHSHVET